MRSPVVGLILVLEACTHGGTGGNTQTIPAAAWSAPDDLGHVPADTPFVFAMLEPPTAEVRAALWAPADARVLVALDRAATIPPSERGALPVKERVVLSILDEMRGSDPLRWWENMGFAHGGHWVLYGLGTWPVLRIDVANAAKLRGIVERVAQTMPDATKQQLGNITYWQLVSGGNAMIAAVLEREAIVAVIPQRAADRLLPLVLGTRLPERSLRTTRDLPELIAKYHLVPSIVGKIDSARVAEALTGDLSPLIGDPGGNEIVTPECRRDAARIAAVVPRALFGYRALEPKRFDGVFVFELDPAIARQLAKLRVTLPALPANALVAVSAGLDVDGLIELVRGWRAELATRPFTCKPLAALAGDVLGGTKFVEQPLPPEAHGLRGAQVILDDATADPPSGSGHAIFAGDQVAVALVRALRQLPGMQNVQLGPDGRAHELPLGALFAMAGIPPLPSFVAIRAGRAALAIGEHAQSDVTTALGAPNREHTPIFELAWDVGRFKARFPQFFAGDSSLLAHWAMLVLSTELDANAFVVDAVATWR